MKFARLSVIVALGIATALTAPAPLAMATGTSAGAGPAAARPAGNGLPYTDPDQKGWLTLCGVDMKPATSGSIHTQPFVWRIVSDTPAPDAYFVKGAKAQMFIYQPREMTPPNAWSGLIMAAASYYSNKAHPMAQFTPIDSPLTQMTLSYPPLWDHLYQIRLYLGAPNSSELTTGYAAADIRVVGDTWTLVAGGHASCTDGKAMSVETVAHMPGSSGLPKPAQSGTSSSGGASGNGGAGGSGGSPGQSGGTASGNLTSASSSTSGPAGAGIAAGVIVVAGLCVGWYLWYRRRQARRVAG